MISPVSFKFFNVATRKLKIAYVVLITLLMDSTNLKDKLRAP